MENNTGPQDENSLDDKGESTQFSEINFTKPIPAGRLREHIQMLLDTKDPNYTDINGFDIEFNYIETQTAQEQYFGDYKTAISQINKNKNRYSNVLPPEKTRVKLRVNEGDDSSDFINANYISGLVPQSEHAYVATQGPLQSTFGDFWRMVWELGAVVITMLTNEVENGKLKCDHYWPEFDCPMTMYPFKVSLETQEGTNELTTRKFNLQNLESGESREVHHFQYTAWPDHGLPVSTTAFLDLAHKVDTVNEKNDPIVVHCSAGIGRSGTFCTVHSIVERLRLDLTEHPDQEPEFNIAKTVLNMRDQRPGMVQTKEQYMFCYLTLLEECERLFTSKQKAKEIANDKLNEAKKEASDQKEPAENPENSTSQSNKDNLVELHEVSNDEEMKNEHTEKVKDEKITEHEKEDKKDEEMKDQQVDAFASIPASEFVAATKSSSEESKWPFGTPTLTHHNTNAIEAPSSTTTKSSSEESKWPFGTPTLTHHNTNAIEAPSSTTTESSGSSDSKPRTSSKPEEVKTGDLINFD